MNLNNIILMMDSYKASHFLQYPPGTEYTYFYIESRGGKYDRTAMFGLQMFIRRYLSTPITMQDIDEAEEIILAHGEPFNRQGWEYIVREHGGRLPIRIKAAPEGLVINTHNVLATVENTDSLCFWLPGYLETAIIRACWYGITACTVSFQSKVKILKAMNKSSENPERDVWFKLHDFGARGSTTHESAGVAGVAHLVNFMGTDTVEALVMAREYYDETMAGFSIPAAEHSTITSWGPDGEIDAYRNMLKQFAKPGKMVAVVSDSTDLMHVIDEVWGKLLKQEIIDSGAVVIPRPDSGNPVMVPVEVITSLAGSYGAEPNSKGFKTLPGCIRTIQGDGINDDTIPVLLDNVMAAGFSVDNLAMGMGGGLHQLYNRDTQKFAMKLSAICVDGEWRDASKSPKGDPGKASKKGRFCLVPADGFDFATVPLAGNESRDILITVFENGELGGQQTLSEIRARAHAYAVRLAA